MQSLHSRRAVLSAAATSIAGLAFAEAGAASSVPEIEVAVHFEDSAENDDVDEAVAALGEFEDQIPANLVVAADEDPLATDFTYDDPKGTVLDIQSELLDENRLGDADIHVFLLYPGLAGSRHYMGGAGFNVWQWGTSDPNAGADATAFDSDFARHIEVDRNYAFAFINTTARVTHSDRVFRNTVIHETVHTFDVNHGPNRTTEIHGIEVPYDEPGTVLEDDGDLRATPMGTWYIDDMTGSNSKPDASYCGTPGDYYYDQYVSDHTPELSPCTQVEVEQWIDEYAEPPEEPDLGGDESSDDPAGSGDEDGSDGGDGGGDGDDSSSNMVIDHWSVSESDATVGETVQWEAEITNWHENPYQTLRMSVGDRVFYEDEDFELEALETAEGSGEITLQPEDAGAEQATFELVEAGTVATADLRVTDACTGASSVGYRVKELSVGDEFRVGESTPVDVAFLHCGDSEALFDTVSLEFGGREVWVDSVLEPTDGTELGDTVDVVPQPGTWGSDVPVRATSDADEEVRTVDVAPAPFDVELDDLPTESDGRLTVESTVTNAGSGTDRQPVELRVDGELLDEQTAELAAGESQSVTLEADVSLGDAEVTVSSATDEARTTVTVGPDLSVSVEPVRDPVTHAAAVVDVEASVENGSDETVAVELVGEGGEASVATPVDVAPGATESETLTVPIDPDPDYDHTLAVRAVVDDTTLDVDMAVVGVVGPIEIDVDGSTPQPLGEDGLYRDVNGDGSLSNGDITLFYSNQHVDPIDSKPAYFDIDGNGDVGQGDVIELFEQL